MSEYLLVMKNILSHKSNGGKYKFSNTKVTVITLLAPVVFIVGMEVASRVVSKPVGDMIYGTITKSRHPMVELKSSERTESYYNEQYYSSKINAIETMQYYCDFFIQNGWHIGTDKESTMCDLNTMTKNWEQDKELWSYFCYDNSTEISVFMEKHNLEVRVELMGIFIPFMFTQFCKHNES